MKLGIQNISRKVFFLYMTLAIINIAFFTVIIYENQIELIADNAVHYYKELTGNIVESLQILPEEMKGIKDGKPAYLPAIEKSISDFIILDQNGEVIARNGNPRALSDTDSANAIRAVTEREFSGKLFFTDIDSENAEITFYLPVNSGSINDSVLIFSQKLSGIENRMKALYRQIGFVILFLVIFHIAVAFLFYRLFIRPLSQLHRQSIALTEGNLSVRSPVQSNDEIGQLASSFNIMAGAIEEKMTILNDFNQRMDFELALAGDVQKLIYPEIRDTGKFLLSVFSKPCEKVNGDYFDIFELGEKGNAFLIADISGHGVPAALLTMTLKEKFNTYAPVLSDPAEIFKALNRDILRMFSSDNVRPHFFSGFYVVINNDNSALFCNAGHPFPLLVSQRTGEITQLQSESGVVGLIPAMDNYFKSTPIQLYPGDKLILLTDGIIEAANASKESFGFSGITETLRDGINLSVHQNVEEILRRLQNFTDIENLRDDATIMGIEIR